MAENATADFDRPLETGRSAVPHSHLQKYLFGFAPLADVLEHVRLEATEDERERLPQIVADWTAVQPDIEAVLQGEAGISETIKLSDLPAEAAAKAASIIDDTLLKRAFNLKTVVALVEIDKLVAAQKTVNLDYAEQLAAGFPEEITLDFLLDFCLSPTREVAPVQHLDLGQDAHVFTSPSTDLRFLGSFLKPLEPADMNHAERGGIPAVAIISFIGYGDAPINVLWSGARAVLNNGFHRVYALRQRGVREIPVVLQLAANASLEFPSRVIDLPRDYLLGHPRPVLMKDFFEEKFNAVLKVKNKLKTITVRSNVQHFEVPC